MADTSAPSATGTSSTPPAASSTDAPVTAAPTTPAPETPPTTTSAPETPTAVMTDEVPGPTTAQDAPSTAEPLFKLPEGISLAPEATSKFEAFLKGKMGADGKVTLTSQEVVDQFLAQAQDANARWQKQIQDTDKANEAACRQRFTPAQLSAATGAVGFFASFDPEFRGFAQRQLNDPVFVNAMRLVGERLSEDTFEIGGSAPPAPAKRSAAERMGYAKARAN